SEIARSNDLVSGVYQHILRVNPEDEKIWKKFIFDYGCDLESLKPGETEEFNNALKKIRQNKILLGEVYDILTD
ncbi:MAG TPA: hypothetical protein VJG31_04335, partial [Candidatus Nanoarchaeia archaeon]|nr:hypothetical protein [Candidatus Nanoarchaeia archaeon]